MWLPAQILTEITGKPRSKVVCGRDFEWSKKSWTHNLFRLYELIFWRRTGIRCEVVSDTISGKELGVSFEGKCAVFESKVRRCFSVLASIRVSIPILQTPIGIPVFASPYVFAIAFDATSLTNRGSPAVTATHTCTGSNLILVTGLQDDAAASTLSTCTYNSVAYSSDTTNLHTAGSGGTEPGSLWLIWLIAPSTGANTISISTSGSAGFLQASSASYSGASQESFPDASAKAAYQSSATQTVSVTVGATNCWGILYAANDKSVGTASTNIGLLRQNTSQQQYGDSNTTLSTGSQTLAITINGGSGTWSAIGVSLAAAAATTRPIFLTLLGVT